MSEHTFTELSKWHKKLIAEFGLMVLNKDSMHLQSRSSSKLSAQTKLKFEKLKLYYVSMHRCVAELGARAAKEPDHSKKMDLNIMKRHLETLEKHVAEMIRAVASEVDFSS